MTIINSVLTGKKPSGTITISSNTTTNVADYEFAVTEVPTTAPTYYVEKTKNTNNVLTNSSNIIDLTGINDIAEYVLYNQYHNIIFPANTEVDFSSLTQLSGSNCCNGCFSNSINIRTVDLSGLLTISGSNACNNMFSFSTVVSVDMSSLQTISVTACNNMFTGCTALTSIDLNNLTTINGSCSNMFSDCSNLPSLKLNSLTTISGQLGVSYGAFLGGCTNLASLELGGLKSTTFSSAVNQLRYLFNTNTGSTATNGCTVHFPSNFDPSDPDATFDITTLSGYPTFGGSASYIHLAFDLPATES